MTDTTNGPPADTWEAILDTLRRRYPGQKDSVLFCINKLQQNPNLGLRDFRDEAKLHGIAMAGRSLHSAKLLLGLIQQTEPRAEREEETEQAPPPRTRRVRERRPQQEEGTIESQVIAAVRQLQDAAGAQSDRLRNAMREAIAVLQRALGD